MRNGIKTFIDQNKSTIIASICASALTAAVFVAFYGATASFKSGVFNSAIPSCEFLGKENRDAPSEESRVVGVVEMANPAVISIVITKDVPIIEQYYQEFNPFGDDPFGDIFGRGFGFIVPQFRQKGTEKREVGGGSGFFISSDGFVVTNAHVVSDEKADYTVLTNDGRKLEAKILAKDRVLDVAILRVEGNAFRYLEFGDSALLKPGQTVIAIGNALGEFRNSVSVGVVSGLSRSIVAGDASGRIESLEGVIQTDAAINLGNSGGPLLDLMGRVIGVNVAMQRGAENVGFALPANAVKNIVDSVRIHGEIVRPYLGVRYILITESVKRQNNLSVDYGALVVRGASPEELAVIPGSPADKAGIVENDIILEVAGVKVEKGKSLASLIGQKQIGQTVRVKILHDGREKEIEVTLEKAPQE